MHWLGAFARSVCIAAFLLAALTASATALPFRLALDDLVGPISFPQLRVEFDFGQSFSHIESLALEITAATTPVEWDDCGLFIRPRPCEHQSFQNGVFAVLNDYPGVILAAVGNGSFTVLPSTQMGLFERRFLPFTFDFLRTGAGSFQIHWNHPVFLPDQDIRNFVPQTGTIYAAALVIDAIPIPEPSTITSLAAALLALGAARRSVRPR
jgi:hypothetical protein